MKCAEERRNLISKPSLTLKVAIESIRTYKVTMKDNTHYKDTSEIRSGVYPEVTAKNKRQCTRCTKCHGKKEDCYVFSEGCRKCHGLHHFEDYCPSKTRVRQRRNHNPKKVSKGISYKVGKRFQDIGNFPGKQKYTLTKTQRQWPNPKENTQSI